MKKSIFLFFAAILCATNAWGVNLTGGEVLYLKPNNNWTSDNAWFAMYLCNGSSDAKWVKMTKDGDYYKATVTVSATGKNHQNVIFCRMNKSNTSKLDWSNVWNQTNDLEYDGKKSLYRVKEGAWSYGDGDWACVCTAGKTIYFNTSNATDWQNPHLRIGRSDYNKAYKLEQVAGTKYLYSLTTVKWQNYEAYTIANNNGYENNHTIYQPSSEKPAYGCEITKLVNYEHSDILTDKYILASEWEKNEDDADYWKTTISNTLPSYEVTYSQTGTGTLTVTKYTGTDYEALTSGSSVLPTQIIKIETNADCKLTVTGATQIDEGNTYYVTANTTITAEFASVAKFAGELTDWANNAKSFTTDGNIATLDLELTQGKHEFKIIEIAGDETIWHGNPGTTSRKNCTDWTFDQDANATINADVTGTYKLTWDFVTNKLTVTYPTFPDLSNQPDIIYFQPSERWTDENARFAAYFMFGNVETDDIWENLTDTDGDGVYEVSNAKQHIAVIIVRMNPAHSENKWDDGYKWNQSADLYIPMNGNNWFKMTATGENWDNSGEWLYYKKVNVTVSASPVEGGLVAGGGTYMYGEDVTLTATANEGYKFVNWTKGGVEVSTDATYTFTATEDAELVANFKATTITLTTGDNSAVIAANIGNTVDVVIKRSFTANDGYYTLCVPFNMDPSVIGKAYSLGTITEHVAGEGININLEEETYELLAGVPYLVLPKANMSELVVENVTIQSDIASGQNVTNGEGTMQIFFEGFYSAPGRTTNGTTEYYVGNNGYLYNGEVEIRGLCGLFTITDWEGNPLKVRARVVTREDAATGFENITNGENTTIKLIENGQLIIIRNGEKFNAQGVRF